MKHTLVHSLPQIKVLYSSVFFAYFVMKCVFLRLISPYFFLFNLSHYSHCFHIPFSFRFPSFILSFKEELTIVCVHLSKSVHPPTSSISTHTYLCINCVCLSQYIYISHPFIFINLRKGSEWALKFFILNISRSHDLQRPQRTRVIAKFISIKLKC